MLYVVFVKGRSLLTTSMPETTQAQLLRGTVFPVASSCGALHLLLLLHPLTSPGLVSSLHICEICSVHWWRGGEETTRGVRGLQTPATPEPTCCYSRQTRWCVQPRPICPSVVGQRRFCGPGVPAEEHGGSGTHRSVLYRLLDLCLSVFFPPLCTLKRCSITACPQEDVCFGSRNDLIDEGIGEGSSLAAFTYGLRKHFLQEPFFLFMSNPVFDRESSAFSTGTVKQSFIISFIFQISSRVPLKRGTVKARSRPLPPALIFLSFSSDKVASSNLIEAKNEPSPRNRWQRAAGIGIEGCLWSTSYKYRHW